MKDVRSVFRGIIEGEEGWGWKSMTPSTAPPPGRVEWEVSKNDQRDKKNEHLGKKTEDYVAENEPITKDARIKL